ncbi:MAG: hypothetical protein WD046_07515 [Paracoccaceae bacterium]
MAAFRDQHELHARRASRNIGLGIVLGVFVAVVFAVTIVKMSQPQSEDPRALNYNPSAAAAEATE